MNGEKRIKWFSIFHLQSFKKNSMKKKSQTKGKSADTFPSCILNLCIQVYVSNLLHPCSTNLLTTLRLLIINSSSCFFYKKSKIKKRNLAPVLNSNGIHMSCYMTNNNCTYEICRQCPYSTSGTTTDICKG